VKQRVSDVEISEAGPGRIALRGALTFETACRAHEAGQRCIEAATAPHLEMDCTNLAETDSAGLVVLLDWLAIARMNQRDIRFTHVPDSLIAVAAISELESLLGIGGA
jgi:phospholipid transport system transporter-binding protein